jgi:UDP-N-acetylglucosamine:LPS N-acetylglucosamine transferase
MTRILYISGSIGLGHVTRDLAIAAELRRQCRDAQICWIAAPPASLVLQAAGETLLPESERWINDTEGAEAAAQGFTLNLTRYLMRASRSWAAHVRVFDEVTRGGGFDLVLGDETYEINVAQMKDDRLNRQPYACFYDFIGLDAAGANPLDRLVAYYWNRVWQNDYKFYTKPQNRAVFLGELEDVPDRSFGILLPNRRAYAQKYYCFAGYVFGFDPGQYRDSAAVKGRLGYGPEPLIVCSIGGTGVGGPLLELCSQAYPLMRARLPDLHMVLVCGPRIPAASLNVTAGVEVREYVPALYEHFAAADLAIVQGGGTTTLELTALKRPFLYFPLEGHSEQERAVSERLARHRAGVRMLFSRTTPSVLAQQALAVIGKPVDYADIPTDGARRAAELVLGLARK